MSVGSEGTGVASRCTMGKCCQGCSKVALLGRTLMGAMPSVDGYVNGSTGGESVGMESDRTVRLTGTGVSRVQGKFAS